MLQSASFAVRLNRSRPSRDVSARCGQPHAPSGHKFLPEGLSLVPSPGKIETLRTTIRARDSRAHPQRRSSHLGPTYKPSEEAPLAVSRTGVRGRLKATQAAAARHGEVIDCLPRRSPRKRETGCYLTFTCEAPPHKPSAALSGGYLGAFPLTGKWFSVVLGTVSHRNE